MYLVNTYAASASVMNGKNRKAMNVKNIQKLQKTRIMMTSVLYVASGSELGWFQVTSGLQQGAKTARQIPERRSSTTGERLAWTETSVFVAEERGRRRTFGIQELKDKILADIDESPPTTTQFPYLFIGMFLRQQFLCLYFLQRALVRCLRTFSQWLVQQSLLATALWSSTVSTRAQMSIHTQSLRRDSNYDFQWMWGCSW